MIHASLTHRQAYLRFNEAESVERKKLIAYNYFLYDAPIVDAELNKAIEKEMNTKGLGD